MHYSIPQIVFQEVPDEISLAISISGCNLKCPGCHSAFTWDEKYGKPLNIQEIDKLLNQYEGLVSCFLFYGGEWEIDNLLEFINHIKSKNIKVCLYTGLDIDEIDERLINNLDYLKTGRYIKSLGGLKEKNTNQKFYKIHNFGSPRLEEINFCY